MKAPPSHSAHGITRLEVIILIVVIAGAGFLFLGALSGAKDMANYDACVNHLKNIGAGLRTFSTDYSGQLPMEVSVAEGGTRDWLADETQLWRHWGRITNGLTSPEDLLCPSDSKRQPSFNKAPTKSWDQLTNNAQLSYFLGLGANEIDSAGILAGDRNLMTNGVSAGSGRLVIATNMVVGFSEKQLHRGVGNLLHSDGGVDQLRTKNLDSAWFAAQTNSGVTPKVWLIP